jgi:hypothetical protein
MINHKNIEKPILAFSPKSPLSNNPHRRSSFHDPIAATLIGRKNRASIVSVRHAQIGVKGLLKSFVSLTFLVFSATPVPQTRGKGRDRIRKLFSVLVFACREERTLWSLACSHGHAVVLGKEVSRRPAPAVVLDSWSAVLREPTLAATPPSHLLVTLGVDEARTEIEFLVDFAQPRVGH